MPGDKPALDLGGGGTLNLATGEGLTLDGGINTNPISISDVPSLVNSPAPVADSINAVSGSPATDPTAAQASAIAGVSTAVTDNAAKAVAQAGALNDAQCYDIRTDEGRQGALRQAQAQYANAFYNNDAAGMSQASATVSQLQPTIDYSQPGMSAYDPAMQDAKIRQGQAGLLMLTTPMPAVGYFGAQAIGADPTEGALFGAAVGNVFLGAGAGMLPSAQAYSPELGLQRATGLDSVYTTTDGYQVLFGQRRVGDTFSTGPDVPLYLSGRTIGDVAADLRSGALSPDQLPIKAFYGDDGQLISANNRSLSALSLAGMQPTNVQIIEPWDDLLFRLTESPLLPQLNLPGPVVPITPTRTNPSILQFIETPQPVPANK